MLESAYPIYAYGGIADFGNSVQKGVIACSTAANSYSDFSVTFPVEFTETPLVMCTIESWSTSAKIGTVTATISGGTIKTTGFSVRLYNADSSKREPTVRWLAIGKIKD